MPLPRLRLTSLACTCALVAACDHPSAPAGTTTGATPDRPPAASASAPAPSASAPPADSAPAAALPTVDPAPVRSAAPATSALATASASAPTPTAHADAGAPKPAKQATIADAGTSDAGTVAATDAGPAAPPSEGQKIALAVDGIFAGRKTFSAHFKQQYTARVTGTVKDSSGTVFVERPNKISFHYDPPSKNRIVSDGSTIKVYIAEDSQMFETPVQKTQYPGALAFMMGNGIATSFDFTINNRAQYTGTILEGKPLTANPSYETVMFYIGKDRLEKKDPGVIERVLIIDSQGNRNRFDFEQASQPTTIDPAEFTFTPPPGTTINH